jgi:hypothetical protein
MANSTQASIEPGAFKALIPLGGTALAFIVMVAMGAITSASAAMSAVM